MEINKRGKTVKAELVIFDLDGTLVDSKDDIINSVNYTLKKLGLKEKKPGLITGYIGWGVEALIGDSLGKENLKLKDKALDIFKEYYRKHATDKTSLYPGVKEILENLKNKRKVIITNRNYEFTISTLEFFEIFEYFDHIEGGDNIECAKPSPCPLDKIVDKFGVEKKKSIIIGDMHLDILAGKRSGIITCGVTYGIGRKKDILDAKPDYVIDSLPELKEIII